MRALVLSVATLLWTTAAIGCGSSLSAASAKVQIVTEAPTGCQALGAVSAKASGGRLDEENAEAARKELRDQTADLGGNVVVVEKEEDRGVVVRLSGQAYQCPPSS